MIGAVVNPIASLFQVSFQVESPTGAEEEQIHEHVPYAMQTVDWKPQPCIAQMFLQDSLLERM